MNANTSLGAPTVTNDPIPRDHNGWPIVPDPADPTRTLKCHRPSGLAKKYIVDTYAVDLWQQRTIIKGAGLRPDLGQLAGPLDLTENKDELNDLASQAAVAGGRQSKANTGTAVHKLLENLLLRKPCDVPPDLQRDIDAIARCLDEQQVEVVPGWVERFVINPTVPAAGTDDAKVRMPIYDGCLVFDLKTGQNPREFSRPIEYAVQEAIYANATHAWRGTGHDLEPVPADVNKELGLILWAPAGTGHAEILDPLDLVEGWRLTLQAMEVRDSRRNTRRMWVLPPTELVLATTEPRSMNETTDAVNAAARLRHRLQYIVEHTSCTVDEVVAAWPSNVPKLTQLDQHTDETVAALSEVVTGLEILHKVQRLEGDVQADLEHIKASMPADLQARFEARLKAIVKPATGVHSRKVYLFHIEQFLPELDELKDVHAERMSDVLQAFEGVDDTARMAVMLQARYGAEVDAESEVPTVPTLTGLEAQRCIALVGIEPYEDANVELVSKYGSKSAALAAGKRLADEHGLLKPRSTAALADDQILTALVLHEAPTTP